MFRALRRWLWRLGARIGFQRDWYLILVAAGIGLVMGSVAMAFIIPLREIEVWTEQADRRLLLWLVIAAPIAGALLTGVVLAWLGTDGQAPGVSSVMYSIHRKKSRMPLKIALGKWVASTLTIGSGGSAGAEGPIVTIGAVIGSNIGRLVRANPERTATLLGCGAAAGIASVFNAPIAGIFFVMEILLRDFSLRTFTPIVIASVVSSAWTRSIMGDTALFGVGPDFFSEEDVFTVMQIPNYLVLGVVAGAVAAAFAKGLAASESFFGKLRAPVILKPAIGAAVLGLMGLAYMLTVGGERAIPDFFGNGYPVIKTLLDPEYYVADQAAQFRFNLIGLLITLAVLKLVATCLTIGSGGSGGMFAPSLLLGAAVGGAFGFVVETLDWFPTTNPAHYALVGMAAMIAATAHAPLTAILMVYEITQSYAIILPLMFAAVISTIVARLIYPDSVYTAKLTQMGVRIGALSDHIILRRLAVHDVELAPAVTVHTFDSAQRLLELSEHYLVRDFVVIDQQNQYVGLVTGDDLSAALVYREAIPLLQVYELQRTDLPTVTMDETLDMVLDKFSRHDVQSLAVLNGIGDATVRGLITRARLMERYQAALSRD